MNLLKGKSTVLFDLDGTLLPMEMERFTNRYFGLLAQRAAPFGYEAKPLVAGIWQGTKAMVKNNGARPNCEAFWEAFGEIMGPEVKNLQPEFDDFYGREFQQAKDSVGENPLARPLVHELKSRGCHVILATNPIFPLVGVETRLSWIGLSAEDFSAVTTYENSTACKPNPAYFREILEKTGKRPEECLMVGNDEKEDMAAEDVGIQTILVTDCLIPCESRDSSHVGRYTFSQLEGVLLGGTEAGR